MLIRTRCVIPLVTPTGDTLARLVITPERDASDVITAPLIEIPEELALEYGESTIQLREGERYEYEFDDGVEANWRLRCSLATRRKSLAASDRDAGRIETRNWCGTLLLELVNRDSSYHPALASALVEVRSIKLLYRTQYRGMLRRVSDELAALVVDMRSSAKLRFASTFEERSDRGWLQIQLEFLSEALDGNDFIAALQRITTFPHEWLSNIEETIRTDRPVRWSPSTVRQLLSGTPRRILPPDHPARAVITSGTVSDKVRVARKASDLDTPENRFIKYALKDFLSFLSHAQAVFESNSNWAASAALASRLSASLTDWLARAMFKEVEELRFSPISSPVLQRRAGYREILRIWLRFRTAAELSWSGGEDLFKVGQRDVASLYEYWLFFQLLDWFCRMFNEGCRPSIEELVDGLDGDSPSLALKRTQQLGPFVGTFSEGLRPLNARFTYNRRFKVTRDRRLGGSWTRGLQPDYTLTFWPYDLTEHAAEERELLVHIHLDAKYRVEAVHEFFGSEDENEVWADPDSTYRREDLLKMHAYRDAIKRSQGAYVIYPGNEKAPKQFHGFHEILPGLGAFSVSPNEDGSARGMKALENFFNEVLKHLSSRTTAMERVTYHLMEAYRSKEEPIPEGRVRLPERDIYGKEHRALPPAEHMVLVAWYRDPKQLAWTAREGLAMVRLGNRRGAWHVQPEFALARHILLHSRRGESAPGLWRLRSPGYKVYTGDELKRRGYPHRPGGEIYAVFEVEPDTGWSEVRWDPKKLIRAIRSFESRIRHKLVINVGRKSAYPRVVPISDLLQATR